MEGLIEWGGGGGGFYQCSTTEGWVDIQTDGRNEKSMAVLQIKHITQKGIEPDIEVTSLFRLTVGGVGGGEN